MRTSATNFNGQPAVASPEGSLSNALTHVVYTRDAAGVVKIYIDGFLSASGSVSGVISNRDSGYRLVLANELGEGFPGWMNFIWWLFFDRA